MSGGGGVGLGKRSRRRNQQDLVATPPGMEPQGPWAAQRQGWAQNLAPWLPDRPSPQLHHLGLGKA